MNLPFSAGPNLAFVLTIFGLLLIYCEFVWIGRIIPGLLGALMAMSGIYWLWQLQPAAKGLGCLASAIVCFALESRIQSFFVFGSVATMLLSYGFWKLYPQPPWILAGLAFPLGALFGTTTVMLLETAKRARRNKRNVFS